jgi:hypothetical protein
MNKEDEVLEPTHYTVWKMQPITFIMQNRMEFWRGNVIKYVARAGFKGDEIQDLEKAIRYLEMRINELSGVPITHHHKQPVDGLKDG